MAAVKPTNVNKHTNLLCLLLWQVFSVTPVMKKDPILRSFVCEN